MTQDIFSTQGSTAQSDVFSTAQSKIDLEDDAKQGKVFAFGVDGCFQCIGIAEIIEDISNPLASYWYPKLRKGVGKAADKGVAQCKGWW